MLGETSCRKRASLWIFAGVAFLLPGGCVACAEVYGRCFAGELEPPMYVSARRRRSAGACLYKPPTKNIALKIFWVLWDLCGLSGVL